MELVKLVKDVPHSSPEIIKKKMNFGDALILKTAIDNHIKTYVGWNIRHFKEKAKMAFYTPADYLEVYEKI